MIYFSFKLDFNAKSWKRDEQFIMWKALLLLKNGQKQGNQGGLTGQGMLLRVLEVLGQVKGLYQALSDGTQYWANIDLTNEWIAASGLLKYSLQSVQ